MQTCPDDEVLARAAGGSVDAELEAHLDACADCRRVLAAVVSEGPRAVRRLERYELRNLLGAGGMGVVYAAWDPKLQRTVAVKVLRGASHERLQREARVMAQLTHPHVVNVFDTGEAEGRVFVAMELLEGGTLRSWLAQPRSAAETLRVFKQAGEGLAAAHDAGIVHRDFKPENVLLGADGRARVTDFGLANFMPPPDAPRDANAPHTGPVGTLAYMAPEQLEGRQVDARADQFAFCVALYEALAGRRPDRPPAAIASPVWRVLRRGLEEDSARRFPSMRALLAALEVRRSRRPWWFAVPAAAAVVALGVQGHDGEAPAPPPAPIVKAAPVSAAAVAAPRTDLDDVVEPAAAIALPRPGALIVVSLDGARTFIVEHLTVVRIADPDIIDVEARDGALTVLGTRRGTTRLTLEFGKRAQTWPVEVRAPIAEAPQAVTLARGEARDFVFAGITRVAVGDSRVVDLERRDGGVLHFKANGAGSTNALVWTDDARRVELRFDVHSAQSLDLIAGLQEVLPVEDVVIATVTPASLCDARLLSDNELLLIPGGGGEGVLTLEHRDGTQEIRDLKVSRK